MNKQKFIECLRSSDQLNSEQFGEIQQVLVDHPYFSIARSVAARAAKSLNAENKGQLITSAAIFATDRKHLKKFINGELIFLGDTPIISSAPGETIQKNVAPESPTVVEEAVTQPSPTPTGKPPKAGEVDQILDELQHDMQALKKSRMHFVEIQNQIDSEESTVTKEREKISESSTEEKVDEIEEVVGGDDTETTEETPSAETDQGVEKEADTRKEAVSGLMIDLEALKKEFQEEEEVGKAKEEKNDVSSESPTETISPESEEISEEEDSEEEELTEPPKIKPSPNVVTNMSEAEENDEGEPGMFDDVEIPEEKTPPKKKKLPARADRDMRMKVKRGDLDRLMGMKSIPKPATQKPSLPDAQELEETAKAPAKKAKATAKKEAKPAAKEETKPTAKKAASKKTATKKEAEKKSTVKKSDADKSAEKKPVKKTEKKTETKAKDTKKKVVAKKTEDTKKEATTKKRSARRVSEPPKSEEPASPQLENPGDDPATKATRKALLDFGKAEGLSMSVSRASPSKRKRSRSGKSKSQGTTKKGGKDDDESGGSGTIIDKFLAENPSIKRRVLSGNTEDLANESTTWHDEVASEYLAEIYTSQGNKARAIRIYENLSLKFPQKKSYFAALIKKLKE